MRRVLGLLLVSLLFVACDGYPDEAVDNFMASCTAQPGATDSACRCIIDELQNTVSFEEFQRLESEILAGGEMPEELRQAVEQCR